MKFRRLLVILAVICLFCVSITANASEVTASGTDGGNLSWTLTSDGVLTISGEGKMADYADRQWDKYAEQIKYVIVEEGVTSVSESAFAEYANLTGVSLPSTLTELDRNAFSYCVNLEKINLPESLETIGVYAFWGCGELSEVYVPESVTSIGYGAFRGCQNLPKIMVDADNMNYCSDEYGVLYSKDMSTLIQCPAGFTGSSYIVPEGVIAIGGTAFEYCASLKEVSLPDGLLEIGQVAFNSCLNLETVNLPGSLESTGEGTFMECSALKNVTIGEGIRYIESNCFTMCTSLESIIIPGSVDIIDVGVFYECTALRTIIFSSDAPEQMSLAFDSLTATAYYPADNTTWTEDKLQDCGGDIEWISYSLFDLAGANMSLGNDLTMYLFVNASDVAEGDYYFEIVKTYADGRDNVVKTVPMSEWTPYATMYYVSFDGVAAKEMTDEFYVTVYHADGTQASNTKVLTIADYAIGMLNRTDASSVSSHNLMADMLNYGAAAQQSMKYAQNDLANANMTAAHKACATQNFSMDQFTNDTVKGNGFMGGNLTLVSNICMNVYFDQNIVDNTMTARVSYTDHNGKKVSYEIPGSEFFVLAGYGFIGVEITTMAAADAERMVTVEILDGSTVVASGSTSVEAMAVNGYATTPLYVDLMKFCTAAYNFFH